MSEAVLTLAVPSKGRLLEQIELYFQQANMPLLRPQGERSYSGIISTFPQIKVTFMTAKEIAHSLYSGHIDIGITGLDLIQEHPLFKNKCVEIVLETNFGNAELVLAVPANWIDVDDMDDIEQITQQFHKKNHRRMRVATKFPLLTEKFFQHHNIVHFRLIQSVGATEAAPGFGQAEMISDLTSTGSTLKANNLKVPHNGIILKSCAVFAINRYVRDNPQKKAQLDSFIAGFSG